MEITSFPQPSVSLPFIHPGKESCTVGKHLTEIRELVYTVQKIPDILLGIPTMTLGVIFLSEEEMVVPCPTFIL